MSFFNLKNMMIMFGGLTALAVVVLILLILFGKYPDYFKMKQGFQDVGAPSVPTFTMFHATWCGHCKTAAPVFKEFMEDATSTFGEKVKIEMIDADSGSPKLKAFNVEGYPTFCLQKTDGTITKYTGTRDAAGYLAFLNKELGIKSDVAGASS